MTHKEILDDLRQPVKDLRDHIPAVFDGNGALSQRGPHQRHARRQDQRTDPARDRRDRPMRRLHAIARPQRGPTRRNRRGGR